MTAEDLGYWYFRLNGFLTIANLAVHPEDPGPQRTDVDVLGVRFPHRQELYLAPAPMVDDQQLNLPGDLPFVALIEVKRGRCELNGPWIRPPDQNMQRVLSWIGLFPHTSWEQVAQALYQRGQYTGDGYHIALVCLGSQTNRDLDRRYPDVRQITWSRVLDFTGDRFRRHRDQKVHHPQWDEAGQLLWRLFDSAPDSRAFARCARAAFDLPAA